FAAAANTLLVAFISTDGPATGTNVTVNSMNNNASAPNLTWTRAQRANTQRGTSEIWWAFAPTAHATMRVNAVLSLSEVAQMRVHAPLSLSEVAQMTVVGFTGAQNTLAGAATAITSKATGVAGEPSLTLTTTKPNSWIFGVGNDWDNRKVLTAQSGSTILA